MGAPQSPSPAAVSCILPLYEDAALARAALASILNQTLTALDVVVVDDSQSADLQSALADLLADPRVRYLPGARTGNAVDNWNLGLSLARGRWSVLVHHDERLVDPGFLERAMRRLEASPGRALLTGAAVQAQPSRFAATARLARRLRLPAWTLYLANWAGPTAALVFPTGTRLQFDPRLAWIVDVDFYVRLWRSTGPFLRDEAIAVVSVPHPYQITARLDAANAHRRELGLLSRDGRLAAWRVALVRGGLDLKRLVRTLGRRAPRRAG
ncbi:MAG TPA: glycosyltransferase family 2 protein [Caulobacteraceae bacterium]|jgi:glycosyltransferase involved in cell wall biosynthesis